MFHYSRRRHMNFRREYHLEFLLLVFISAKDSFETQTPLSLHHRRGTLFRAKRQVTSFTGFHARYTYTHVELGQKMRRWPPAHCGHCTMISLLLYMSRHGSQNRSCSLSTYTTPGRLRGFIR